MLEQRVRVVLSCLVGLLTLSAPAAAGDAAPREPKAAYRFAWTRGEGADACPSEQQLTERVVTRLKRNPFADSAEQVLEGSVMREGNGWHAVLRVRGPDGRVLGRRDLETQGDDCSGLTAAATLAVVLTIDPTAPLDEGESATASFPVPETSAPAASATPPPVSPNGSPSPAAAPRQASRTESSASEPRRGYFSASAVGQLGLLPRASAGVELDVRLPVYGIDVVGGLRVLPLVATSDAHLEFGITTGVLGVCGGRAFDAVQLSLCGVFHGGVITAVVRDLNPIAPGNYPWLAFEAGPRLSWPGSGTFGVELGLSAVVPFIRHDCVISSSPETAFQAAAVGGLLTLGIRGATS